MDKNKTRPYIVLTVTDIVPKIPTLMGGIPKAEY